MRSLSEAVSRLAPPSARPCSGSLEMSENVREFEKAFDVAQQYLVKLYRLLDLYWLIGGREFLQACESVHKFVNRVADQGLEALNKAVQENPDRYVLLEALAQDPLLDKTATRDQLLNILLAGGDTTACSLSWTMYVTRSPVWFLNLAMLQHRFLRSCGKIPRWHSIMDSHLAKIISS